MSKSKFLSELARFRELNSQTQTTLQVKILTNILIDRICYQKIKPRNLGAYKHRALIIKRPILDRNNDT